MTDNVLQPVWFKGRAMPENLFRKRSEPTPISDKGNEETTIATQIPDSEDEETVGATEVTDSDEETIIGDDMDFYYKT